MARRKRAAKSDEMAEAAPSGEGTAAGSIVVPAEAMTAREMDDADTQGPNLSGDTIETAGVGIPPEPPERTNARPPDFTEKSAPGAPTYAADPRPVISVNLCGYAGGQSMHLLRSHRFRQMQIRFDRGQPDEEFLAMLKRAGWTDRTEAEGVWTKQIDPNARWQSVARMEQDFKAVANAIREARGMEPVLEGLTPA